MTTKMYFAKWLYRSDDGQLREARQEIKATSKRDATITAKRIAEQNDWRLMDILIGGY